MALILCLETATEVCSVALSKSGKLLRFKEISEGFQHASRITLLIEQCLQEAEVNLNQLDAIAVSIGPGSYTGLRVGVSAAKGYCLALGKPLISLDTLTCMAYGALESTNRIHEEGVYVCPMLDARRMEVYTAIYDSSLREIASVQALILDDTGIKEFFPKEKTVLFTGNGAHKFESRDKHKLFKFLNKQNSAADMVLEAYEKFCEKNYSDARFCTPFYLKSPHITQANKVL